MQQRIQQYSVFRFVVALAILGSTIWLVLAGGWDEGPDHVNFFRLSAAQLLAVVLTTLWARTRAAGERFIYLQFVLDVAGASVLSAWTGGSGSLVTILYFPTIAAGAYLIGRNGAIAVAVLSTIGLLGAAWYEGVPDEFGEIIYWETGFRILSFFLVAILSGQLAESLAVAGEALKAQQIASETVLERVRAGVLTSDIADVVTSVNPSARILIGDARGKRLADVFHGSIHHRTWEETRPEGRRWVCSQATLPDGGRVVVIEDVTELWQMRERAQRDERFVAVGKLSAGLAHEIRNPLASLSGLLQLLAEERSSREIALALGEAERLNRLVEDFLQAARAPTLRCVPTRLDELAAQTAVSFGQDPRFVGRVHVKVTAEPVQVPVDPDRVRQVLWNLVLNAAQAMPQGGEVEVNVSANEAGTGSISVADRGVGIDASERERIFDPFYTRRHGGTGLGLALVDQVVRAHGGHIEVAAREGGGTSFNLWFPLQFPQGT